MKILALDGGGVFGRTQSRIMAYANCYDKFDAFVGTSIGSVQAVAFAMGRPEVVSPNFFDRWMPKVFKATMFGKYNIFKPEYSDVGLNAALNDIFGSTTLGQVKRPVFVTAADIGQKTLKVFSSLSFEDQSWPAWEVCRAATAAETFFPPWKGYADGGIYANNPSMVGLAAAVRVLGEKIENIEILSIGTGDDSGISDQMPESRLGAGLWIIKAMLNGASDKMHDYFVKSLPIKKYTRIQFIRDQSWKMDNPRDMYYAERKWAVEIQDAVQIVKDF